MVKSALAIKQIHSVFPGRHQQSCLQVNSIFEYQTDSTAHSPVAELCAAQIEFSEEARQLSPNV
jgi:hypothetical protein